MSGSGLLCAQDTLKSKKPAPYIIERKKADKIDRAIERVDSARLAMGSINNMKSSLPQKIYSNKKIKAMLDSAGIGKMDTLLAFASLAKPVGDDELINKINSTFLKGMSKEQLGSSLKDISGSKLRDEALKELPPLAGRKISPDNLQLAKGLLKKKFGNVDSLLNNWEQKLKSEELLNRLLSKQIDSLQGCRSKLDSAINAGDALAKNSVAHLNDSLNRYRSKLDSAIHDNDSIKSITDSLYSIRRKYVSTIDSLYALRHKGDSLKNKYESELNSTRAALLQKKKSLDSAQQFARDPHLNYNLSEKDVTSGLKTIAVKHKPAFFEKFYFEGIASVFRNIDGRDQLSLSPGLGAELIRNFSIGASPNITIRTDGSHLKFVGGYRVFAKYQVFSQRAYLQLEDWVKPTGSIQSEKHKILGGAGVLIPFTKKLSINTSILYQVNGNGSVSDGSAPNDSRWVFRVGISSIGEKKIKRN